MILFNCAAARYSILGRSNEQHIKYVREYFSYKINGVFGVYGQYRGGK